MWPDPVMGIGMCMHAHEMVYCNVSMSVPKGNLLLKWSLFSFWDYCSLCMSSESWVQRFACRLRTRVWVGNHNLYIIWISRLPCCRVLWLITYAWVTFNSASAPQPTWKSLCPSTVQYMKVQKVYLLIPNPGFSTWKFRRFIFYNPKSWVQYMKVQKVYLLQSQILGNPTQCLLRHSQPIKSAKVASYPVGGWAEIHNHVPNRIRLHHQIDQAFPKFSRIRWKTWEGLGTRLVQKYMHENRQQVGTKLGQVNKYNGW